jgi:hypothetical protein
MAVRIVPGLPTKIVYDERFVAMINFNSGGVGAEGAVPVWNGTKLVWSAMA